MKIVTFSRDPFRKAVEIACQAHAGQVDKIDPTRCEASPCSPEKLEFYRQAKKMLGMA